MTERGPTPGAPVHVGSLPGSAGALLREARLAQGVHIAALAASIKVSPRKLEALENDKYDELLDPAFARALAKTVCRVLKIEAEPVLARMPSPPAQRLEQAARGLDQPFRDHGALRPSREPSALLRPVVWGPLLIVLAAFGLMLLPPGLLRDFSASISSSAPPASAVATPLFPPPIASAPEAAIAAASAAQAASAAAAVAEAAAAAPAPASAALASEPAAMIVITARADSWIGILDGNAHPLIARTVRAGETVRFDGTPPFRIKVGNAAGTELIFRGQAVDLPSTTRDNVARLELK